MSRRGKHAREAAFTLVELLAVALIIAVLAALALPWFQRHVVRGKRLEAQAALMQLMQQQERYYSQNNRYLVFSAGSTDPQAQRFKWWSGETAATSAYEISGAACPQSSITECVLLTAAPGTGLVDGRFRDVECETLSLTSSGLRRASGGAARCWP